ncbi:DUF4380 domain-containing protein [Bacteroidota bacterium]
MKTFTAYLLIIFSTIWFSTCRTEQAVSTKASVVWLQAGDIRLGVLPEVGGRIVFYGLGNVNLLKADTSLWEESELMRPSVKADEGWKSYYGHTVWIGPQSEWWIHQDLNSERKDQRAVWPPDPWLIYANYSVIELTDSSLVIEGPASPVSGIRLTKRILLQSNGKVEIHVIGKNIREEEIAWDLWMNTRIDGYAEVYVPCEQSGVKRIQGSNDNGNEAVEYNIADGFFHFMPALPSDGKRQRSSKAFLNPSQPWMAAFIDSLCFIVEFDLYDPDQTHPEQGMVEIYNSTSNNADEALTEMEYHGPYSRILPGESIEVTERWSIVPYSGKVDEYVAFLRQEMGI